MADASPLSLPPEQALRLPAPSSRKAPSITGHLRRPARTYFTVAKAMEMDVLDAIRGAVDVAKAEGKTAAWFTQELTPTLQKLAGGGGSFASIRWTARKSWFSSAARAGWRRSMTPTCGPPTPPGAGSASRRARRPSPGFVTSASWMAGNERRTGRGTAPSCASMIRGGAPITRPAAGSAAVRSSNSPTTIWCNSATSLGPRRPTSRPSPGSTRAPA